MGCGAAAHTIRAVTDTATAQDRLAAWDAKVQPLIVAAAILPFALALFPGQSDSPIVLAVDLASWAVFFVDLVVRVRLARGYLRTGTGLFDLSIVVFTFPWYILPGVDGTQFLAVFRLARLLRLVTATSAGRRLRYLYDQMGSLLLVSIGVLLFSAIVVLRAEPPESGFDTFGDAMWWGVVTLTTVGYGDYFPVTRAGRFAGLLVMVIGLAVLGTLAGILASIFGGSADEPAAAEEAGDVDARLQKLDDRLAGMEQQLASLERALIPGSDDG